MILSSQKLGSELETESEQFTKQIRELEYQLDGLRARMTQLDQEYVESKRLWPLELYKVMKNMINAAISGPSVEHDDLSD